MDFKGKNFAIAVTMTVLDSVVACRYALHRSPRPLANWLDDEHLQSRYSQAPGFQLGGVCEQIGSINTEISMCNVQVIRREPGLVAIPFEKAIYCHSCEQIINSTWSRCGLCGSDKEGIVKHILQSLQSPADCWLTQQQGIRCTRDVPLFRKYSEDHQKVEIGLMKLRYTHK